MKHPVNPIIHKIAERRVSFKIFAFLFLPFTCIGWIICLNTENMSGWWWLPISVSATGAALLLLFFLRAYVFLPKEAIGHEAEIEEEESVA